MCDHFQVLLLLALKVVLSHLEVPSLTLPPPPPLPLLLPLLLWLPPLHLLVLLPYAGALILFVTQYYIQKSTFGPDILT
jgi:hypothetical protein